MGFQNYGIKTIKDFLGDTYHIPNYQREYSWDKEELEDFWTDLSHTVNSNDDRDHFFGQIVIHNDESKKEKNIIDGQQRTITSTIFIRVLYNYFSEIEKNDPDDDTKREAKYRCGDIESRLIGRYTKKSNDLHLTLGESDADYFRDNIQLAIPSNEKSKNKSKPSHERLRKAYWLLHSKVEDAIKNNSAFGSSFDLIDKLYSTFIDRFKVLYMEATKLEEAFIVFETLNARGKDLETADLLKNYIFSQASDISSSQKSWNMMLSSLDKADPTKFIRSYWNSEHQLTREKELYREITREVINPLSSNNLLKGLSAFAPIYHDLVNPEECSYFTDDKIIKKLKILKTLKASTFYPVVFSMINRKDSFSDNDLLKVLDKIIDYIFRNFTICGNVANSAEVVFINLANDIHVLKINSADDICKVISEKIISDQEFENQFTLWEGTKSTKETVRYILRRIYHQNKNNAEINIDNNDVHIEHIMPEDRTNWQNISEEDHDAYLWRLGNLTLLSRTLNISVSNNAFINKKQKYIDSKIEENIEIAQKNDWSISEIENRQRDLSKIALKLWKK